ncbi:MAG: hypothetical protein ABSE63_03550 [Thermoguttaceae bacterium]
MKPESIASCLLGLIGVSLFTILLVYEKISQVTYLSLIIPLALVCVVLLCLPRLQELDLKNLRIILHEIRQAKSELETVKADIVEMYGGIDNLRKAPLILDKAKMEEFGLDGGHIASDDVFMRYIVGCFKRERERLAKIFVSPKSADKIAEAIVDNSLDGNVFKWNGPETPLDIPPLSVADRKRKEDNQGR